MMGTREDKAEPLAADNQEAVAIIRFIRRHPVLHRLLGGPRALRRAILQSRESVATEVLDRLAAIAVEDVVIQVKEFDAAFSSSPRSDLLRRLLRYGEFEPTLSRIFFDNISPDLDIVDVGANIGFYTVGGAKRLSGGKVLSIEPTSGAFERLKTNIVRNDVQHRVILFNGLIAGTTGQTTRHSVEGREEYSSMGEIKHPSIKKAVIRRETVEATTLDEIVEKHQLRPHILKVDVEGAEAQVYAGAQRVLSTFRPVVISEISNFLLHANGADGREIVRMFEAFDYRVVDPHDPLAEPGTAMFGDIVCTPHEAKLNGA